MLNGLRENSQPSPSPSKGEVILIPKDMRAEWMDVMALDPDLSPTAFKVAGVIGYHFNSKSGDTFVGQKRIASLMGLSERTVWGTIGELERLGYLIVHRRDLGTSVRQERTGKSTTVRYAGGKGVANTYAPAFQRSQVAATNTGRKLAEYCDQYVANGRKIASQRSQNRVAMVAADCDPTLKVNPIKENPRESALARDLADLVDLLEDEIGRVEVQRWFAGVALDQERTDDRTVVFSVPSSFVRKIIRERFEQTIIACWRQVHSRGTERLELIVRPPQPAVSA